jgi:chromate transporter
LSPEPLAATAPRDAVAAVAVFRIFLRLGFSCFGGPIAHLGYFRDEFVRRRGWLDEKGYADLLALCQFLPGPASSQLGFALGISRAGLAGGLAAWLGFTLPSAVALFLFAVFARSFTGPIAEGLIHGLKIVAVAVVAQAVWGMARSLAPDKPRAGIALAAMIPVTLVAGSLAQLGVIALGALGGALLCRSAASGAEASLPIPLGRRTGLIAFAVFLLLLLGLPAAARLFPGWGVGLFDAFYRSGALVFGGGHVVLPLLQAQLVAPGWLDNADFLAGYGAAQAVPGPMFAIGAYLGAVAAPAHQAMLGAILGLVGLFLPGLLILTAALPFWDRLRRWPAAPAMMAGVNAAVVGLLGAALYSLVWVSAIRGPHDFLLAAACFLLLMVWRLPAWVIVIVGAGGGLVLALI